MAQWIHSQVTFYADLIQIWEKKIEEEVKKKKEFDFYLKTISGHFGLI